MEAALAYAASAAIRPADHQFPRIADKLAMMAPEIMSARQLTFFAARRRTWPPLRPRSRHGEASRCPRAWPRR